MGEKKLLSVRRLLLPADHQQLRTNIPRANRLGDLSIKWLRLGEAGLTLVERGKYLAAMGKQAGKLATMDTVEVENYLNREVLPNMPGGNGHLTTRVTDVRFFGKGRFRSIAYVLESEEVQEQWQYLTTKLDQLNGVTSYWGEFEPHVAVATIPQEHTLDGNHILDTFWDFSPETMTFLPATAKAS